LRNWEQGRRVPEGPARALLIAIDRAPGAVMRALQG
jgi:putative transcriptional regulator